MYGDNHHFVGYADTIIVGILFRRTWLKNSGCYVNLTSDFPENLCSIILLNIAQLI